MAKIGALEIGTIKIKNGALTAYYMQTGSGANTITLTVPDLNGSQNPIKLFAWGTNNEAVVTRTRGAKVIGRLFAIAGSAGQIRGFLFDGDPEDGDEYVLNTFQTTYKELSAEVRLR